MMNVLRIFFYFNVVLLIVYNSEVLGKATSSIDKQSNLDAWVPELYSLYKESLGNDKEFSTRRFNINDTQYTLHVQKLKEVNGLKTHNLKVEERIALRGGKDILYINNPVEAKMPNAYMTIDQFKNSVLERILKQKEEIEKVKKLNFIKYLKKANKKFKRHKIFKTFNKHDVKLHNIRSTKMFKKTYIPTTQIPTFIINNVTIAYVNNFTDDIKNKLNQSSDISSDESDITETTTDDSVTETIYSDALATDIFILNLTEDNNSLINTTNSTLLEVTNVSIEDTTVSPDESVSETITDSEEFTTETIIAETETVYETETTTKANKVTRRTQSRPFVFLGES